MVALTPSVEYMVHNSEKVDIDWNCSPGGEKHIGSEKGNWFHTFKTRFFQLLSFIQNNSWGRWE